MRKNISCHPVSKIPGELSRNEAVPSHMEYDLTQFCLQPIEILEHPPYQLFGLGQVSPVNSVLKWFYLFDGVYNGKHFLFHHSKGCYED